MSAALALQARPIAVELHALLRDLDPARWREDMEAALRERVTELRSSLEALRDSSSADEALARLTARVTELEALLRSQAAGLSEPAALTRDEWVQFGARLRPAYESLRQSLHAEDIHVPSLRPTNYRRNLLHFSSGFVALGIIVAVPSPLWMIAIAGGFFVYAWTMELVRRYSPKLNERLMRFYGPIAHPHEWTRVNSATWYCTALLGLALTGSLEICTVAVLVLGAGDPLAAIVGRRWGRTKLLHGRTLEGSLAFVAAGGTLAFGGLALFFPALGLPAAAALAFSGAIAGAVAELLSRRVDDNLTIPIAAGLAAWAMTTLLTLPLT